MRRNPRRKFLQNLHPSQHRLFGLGCKTSRMDESQCHPHFSFHPPAVRQRRLTSSCNFFLRRTNNRFKRTAPKSRTSSAAKTGFVASLASPTFRLKPNPCQIPLPPTPPPLPQPRDPGQNPTLVPLHCPQTQTGALPSCPIIDARMPTSPPRVSPPPYQVSFTALLPPLCSPMLFDR